MWTVRVPKITAPKVSSETKRVRRSPDKPFCCSREAKEERCRTERSWLLQSLKPVRIRLVLDRGKWIKWFIYSAHSQGQRQIVSKIMTLLLHLISHSHVTSSNDGYFVSWLATRRNVKCFSVSRCKWHRLIFSHLKVLRVHLVSSTTKTHASH